MAKKKIYAVRKGHKTGLFNTWAECQKATAGYSGAEFRGFTEKEEALAFLNMETTKTVSGDKSKEAAGVVEVPENMVIAYVDGSFEKSIGRYAFGCVLLTPDGQEIRESGSGSDPAGVAIRNVAGEMLGAMNAVKWAQENGYPAVEIRYDYEGVEKWVTGVWRAKTPLTSKYAVHMQEAGKKIQISFCKVAAHTGNHYNEEADQLAKSALLRTDEEVKIV
ncbi:ribonuclease H1 domain-containing protein [Blautia sp. HCN-1074]|jgi:viroplasmin and RNaseH domain-containing protein|uniref:ribonuclease H1 domain-containing protein n=1 Tax=Blautia sp. HCN-1074 TaxID=3134667 RepID=UPI000E4329E2|nr:ribonuclease H family protein [uncultured Blautia sp.]MBS6713557.1 ribonuclease H family protein [Ruminococcus sp.]RGI60340.1 RNAse H family protein [Ruminococcus sp. TM10-9AT]RGY88222.1 RNAse H family protein [Ruminococcus sp. AM58-7XD]RHD95746.1 RNAse H family protein [Ruminococcus sp. AM30-15AC]RHG57242.1 RNAse H family protein [Ruminococcus sp. AM22-13]RHQ63595.1 RNAse H family protein [Ruminococcus sp. AF24-32LB]RHQ90431.1 RNAse H family protein [Ruminococcus sp. AF21-3]RHT62426.1 R